MDTLIGRSLNRYKILVLLGSGGIGSVYKALDTTLQREVAIKVMKPELARHLDFRDRFLQEARIAARLDHPNIVQVHDFGQSGDLLYIVMDYIPGNNLRKILQELKTQNKWVVLTEAVQIVQQVARALDTAHSQGILHLDVKPENLMLKPEPTAGLPYRVVVTDLGLARLQNGQINTEHISMGTPAYMSPEQAEGKTTDARSDVYSLGILLYELCAGRTPFTPQNLSEAVEAHTRQPVPMPRSIHPDLPEPLEKIILKALEKDPGQRYSHAGELANALDEILPAIRLAPPVPENVEDTVSLTTQIAQKAPSDETQVDLNPAPPSLADTQVDIPAYLEVLMPDKSMHTIQFKSEAMTIGRDPTNDLVLDLPKVSRQHARVHYDGSQYILSDLNSRNGTYLSGQRLTPSEPQVWLPEKTVKIGDVYLTLKKAEGTIPPTGPVQAASQARRGYTAEAAMAAAAQPGAKQDRIALYADTIQVSTLPGTAATASLVLINRGTAPDNYRINVLGIPPAWVTAPPPIIQLPASGRTEIKIGITPAKMTESHPGRYPVTIRAASLDDPSVTAQVDIILTVGVFTQFTSDLRPRKIEPEETFTVTVQNQSNARQSFAINLSDPHGELLFDPPQARLSLAEGEAAAVQFRGTLRRRPLISGTVEEPFIAQVTPSDGGSQTLNGQMAFSGIFPPAIIPIVLVLCLCLTSIVAYGFYSVVVGPSKQMTATASTAIAAATQTALAFADQGTLNASNALSQTRTAVAILALTSQVSLTPSSTPTPSGTPTQSATPTLTQLAPAATATPTQQQTPTQTSTSTPTQTPVIIVITNTPLPPTITPTPPKPTPTPLGGSWIIAFSTNRDGNYEIYVMLSDGSKQTRVTNNPASDTHPVISPDGARLLFVSNRDGNSQIYVMSLDGAGQTRLSNNNFNDFSPAWSPDGKHIVFSSTRTGTKEIFVMDANGANQTQFTNDPSDDDHPGYSPDGSKIVYDAKSTDGKTQSIKTMNADGLGQVDLTNNGAVNYAPSYSRDGTRITFISNKSGSFEVYQMNANGSSQSRVTSLGTTTFSPRYSHDGLWITFVGQQGGVGQIYIIQSDGSGLQNLTNNTVDNIDPDW